MLSLHTDKEYILSRRMAYEDRKLFPHYTGGIYYLISEGLEIVYVGSSFRIKSRIYAHQSAGEIPFKWFAYIECIGSLRAELEREAIISLKPERNIKFHPDRWPEVERERHEKRRQTLARKSNKHSLLIQ